MDDKQLKTILDSVTLEVITPDVVEWQTIGQDLVGVLVGVDAAPSREDGETYNRYTLKTLDGLKNCGLGKIADQIMGGDRYVGHAVRFIYEGQKKSGTGNMLNMFTVSVSPKPVV